MAIYNTPTNIDFSLPHSDGDGERIKVSSNASKSYITIQTDDDIFVDKSDIGWLINILQDMKKLYEESKNTAP
jgi:hypothetical protein